MFKKVFSIAAFFLAAVCMNLDAQELQSHRFSFNKIMPKTSSVAVKTQVSLNDGEYWWGYWDGTLDMVQMIGMGANTITPQKYMGATCILAGTKDMDERIIEGVAFSYPSAKNITDVKIWISESLPSTAENASITCQKVDQVTGYNNIDGDQINEIRFEKPYKVDITKDTYIGYSFVVSKDEGQFDQYPIFTTGGTAHTRGLMVKVGDNGEWSDYQEYGFGDLAMRFLLSGGKFEDNNVQFTSSIGDLCAVKGTEVKIPLEVKNMGGNGFTSLGITIDAAGEKQEVTITPDSKVTGINTPYKFNLTFKAPEQLKSLPITVTIDKVNGEANTSVNNSIKGNILVISRLVDHKVLFEEFTATWCGFCPRGAVGIAKAKQVYGDKIVPVAIHYEDEMDCKAYHALIKNSINGFPGSHIGRTFMDVDPYFGKTGSMMFGIKELIDACIAEVPSAEVNGEAEIDGNTIKVKSDVKFLYNGKVNCAVAYVITEDGIKNDEWWQGNNYSGAKGFDSEPLFDQWVNADKKAKGVVYNEVAIIAEGVNQGINSSIPTDVVADESNIHEIEFTVSDYPLIMNGLNLNLCTFVIDRNTGRVINADIKPVTVSAGINDNYTDNGEVEEIARYTIDGRRIYTAEKGVNIVKYSNGSVKKVIVR